MRAKWLAAVAGTTLALSTPATAMEGAAMDVPVPVAPGEVDGVALVRGTCPTFHWGEVDRARAYDLVVFRLAENDEAAAELYRVRLPGVAQGWTPGVERCLEPGGRYAWALRAIGSEDQVGAWSPARVFALASGPGIAEVEEALLVLQRWMETGGRVDESTEAIEPVFAGPGADAPAEMTADTDPQVSPAGKEVPQPYLVEQPPVIPRPLAPTPGTSALSIDLQLHLGTEGHVVKEGELLLWDEKSSANTAFGRNALKANDFGFSNTAVGTSALSVNATGVHNTAVGKGALETSPTGSFNTGVGSEALQSTTAGQANTGVGWEALTDNQGANNNTAVGAKAMHANTTGANNTGVGVEAIGENLVGNSNTAVGNNSMHDTKASNNTAVGARSLRFNAFGSDNVAVGLDSLLNAKGSRNTAVGPAAGSVTETGNDNIYIGSGAVGVMTESNTIRIGGTAVGTGSGQQNRAFVNGITGVNVSGAAVLVNGNGQLGVAASSRRYKQGVQDMGEVSRRLLALRPVTFSYRDGSEEGPWPLEFGLIAEEVAEVFPELVAYDDQGRPQTVKYHLLASILLNELQLMDHRIDALGGRIETLSRESD